MQWFVFQSSCRSWKQIVIGHNALLLERRNPPQTVLSFSGCSDKLKVMIRFTHKANENVNKNNPAFKFF